MKLKQGFGILEIIVAMGLFLLVAAVGVATVLHSFSVNRLSDEETKAKLYAQEGIEGVQSIKKKAWSNIAAGTYGLSTTGNTWSFSGSSNTQGPFTRQIAVSAVRRDGSGKIVTSGGTIDPDTFKVTSTVTWNFAPNRNNTVELIEYLTNWTKPIAGNWSTPILETTVDVSGSQDANRVQCVGNYCYYLRSGANPSFIVFDVTNPLSPTQVGSLNLSGTTRDMAISGSYAYVGSSSNNSELLVVDISNPASPSQVGTYNASGNSDANGIFAVGTTVYMVRAVDAGDNEFVIINCSTPTSPTLVGSVDLATTGNEVTIMGNYAYVATADNARELIVVNITTPASPTVAGSLNLSGTNIGLFIEGFSSTIVMGLDTGSIQVISVATPTSPSLTGSYSTGGQANSFSLGNSNNYVFLATNNTAAEFQVISIANPAAPSLVGSLNLSDNLNDAFYLQGKDRVFAASTNNTGEILIIKPS